MRQILFILALFFSVLTFWSDAAQAHELPHPAITADICADCADTAGSPDQPDLDHCHPDAGCSGAAFVLPGSAGLAHPVSILGLAPRPDARAPAKSLVLSRDLPPPRPSAPVMTGSARRAA